MPSQRHHCRLPLTYNEINGKAAFGWIDCAARNWLPLPRRKTGSRAAEYQPAVFRRPYRTSIMSWRAELLANWIPGAVGVPKLSAACLAIRMSPAVLSGSDLARTRWQRRPDERSALRAGRMKWLTTISDLKNQNSGSVDELATKERD